MRVTALSTSQSGAAGCCDALIDLDNDKVFLHHLLKSEQGRRLPTGRCAGRPRGLTSCLQVRARVLNDELGTVFQHWYPAFVAPTESAVTQEFAA